MAHVAVPALGEMEREDWLPPVTGMGSRPRGKIARGVILEKNHY
jgi:hypothetical protein